MMNLVRAFGFVALIGLVGCGKTLDAPPGEAVEIKGKVTVGGKTPPAGTQITLQPTAGSGQMVFFKLGNDGGFTGKLNAGSYSYYLQPGAMNEAAFEKAVPKDARFGSMDRQIEVKAGAGTVELKL